MKRLKYCAARINEKVDGRESDLPYTGLEHIESWTGRLTPSEEISTSEGQSSRYEPGDVLFGKLRPYLAKVFRAKEHGICTGELLVLRPKDVSQDYLFSYMLARDFIFIVDSSTYGAKMPRASWDFIGDLPVLLPSEAEQHAIAAFLDRETGRIDTLIAKKGRQIELLQEKRTALISHAVTRGLDPDALMKDSGVEWLGEVPEHWNIVHLKRVFHSTDYGISESLQADGVYGILRMGDIQDGEILMDDLGYVDSVAQELLLDQGDLVFNRTNSLALVGKVGIFRGTIEDNISFASYLVRFRIKDTSDPEYFNYMLNRPEVLVKASSMALPSIGQANLNPNRYGYLRICAPPKKEQDEIARFLRDKTCKIDRLKEKIHESISKLREYRTSLVSAAVTGKIDVREELVS